MTETGNATPGNYFLCLDLGRLHLQEAQLSQYFSRHLCVRSTPVYWGQEEFSYLVVSLLAYLLGLPGHTLEWDGEGSMLATGG